MPLRPQILAFGLLAFANSAFAAPVKAPPGMKLVWNDEFNTGSVPDPKKWSFERGFSRNEEAQWYQPDNATIKSGILTIEARRERRPNPNYRAGSSDWRTNREFIEYTSSSLVTGPKGGAWKYGRFEMRARIDTRPGIWPAFWTVGQSGEWPDGGEIDIMEFYRGKVLANFAWGTSRRWNAKWNAVARPIEVFGDPNWSKKFHVWRLDWDENKLVISMDGLVLNTQDVRKAQNATAGIDLPFTRPQTILLNLAIGGQNGGDPSKTTFPSKFEVDYVRVFQKK
jgi:beta-glucanase (GH16 family)